MPEPEDCEVCGARRLPIDKVCIRCRSDFSKPNWQTCPFCGLVYVLHPVSGEFWSKDTPPSGNILVDLGHEVLEEICDDHGIVINLSGYSQTAEMIADRLGKWHIYPELRTFIPWLVERWKARCDTVDEFKEGAVVDEAKMWLEAIARALVERGEEEDVVPVQEGDEGGTNCAEDEIDGCLSPGGDSDDETQLFSPYG